MSNEIVINEYLDKHKIITWKLEHENILIEWSDKAMCFRWLHAKSHSMYSYRNAWFTIPVIIISTCTGTANFAQDRFNPDYKDYVVMIVGAFNIFAGIITTIQQFLKITQLNEAHRVSSIAWGKFHRNIKLELAKRPNERMAVTNMLKISKEEFDRLMETSPTIPESIIDEFNNTFPIDNSEFKKDNIKDIINKEINEQSEVQRDIMFRPEICDSLSSTNNFRYRPKKKEQVDGQIEVKINSFIKNFFILHGRNPFKDEIIEYLDENNINNSDLSEIIDRVLNKLSISDNFTVEINSDNINDKNINTL